MEATPPPLFSIDPNLERVARTMFEAYNGQGPNPWKTFDGRDVPQWKELGEQVRAKWLAAAEAASVMATDFLLFTIGEEISKARKELAKP